MTGRVWQEDRETDGRLSGKQVDRQMMGRDRQESVFRLQALMLSQF